MTLNDILFIMQNRLIALSEARRLAVSSGDLDRVSQIDIDITTTQTVIQQLQHTMQNG